MAMPPQVADRFIFAIGTVVLKAPVFLFRLLPLPNLLSSSRLVESISSFLRWMVLRAGSRIFYTFHGIAEEHSRD